MNTPTVYVICDANCKFEGMTKEQILTAIVQAVNEGTIGDINTGFITTVKTINGTPLKFFVGKQADYDLLTDEDKQNLFAIITDDTTKEGILTAIKELQETATSHGTRLTNLEKQNNKLPLVCTVEVTNGVTRLPLDKIAENTPYLMVFEKSSGAGYGARYSAIYIHNVCIATTVIIGDWKLSIAGEHTGDRLLDVTFYKLADQSEETVVDGTLSLYKLGVI